MVQSCCVVFDGFSNHVLPSITKEEIIASMKVLSFMSTSCCCHSCHGSWLLIVYIEDIEKIVIKKSTGIRVCSGMCSILLLCLCKSKVLFMLVSFCI